jgi:hypothetical protein
LGSQAKKAPSGPFADKLWRDAIRKAALEQAEGKRGPKKLELAARALVNAAITGDVSAAKEMGDRLDGKATQQIETTITDKRMVVEAPAISSDSDAWERQYGRPN